MDSKRFKHALLVHDRLSETITNELKSTVKKYPWFQTARMLWLKGLSKKGCSHLIEGMMQSIPYLTHNKQLSFLLEFESSRVWDTVYPIKPLSAPSKPAANNSTLENTIDRFLESLEQRQSTRSELPPNSPSANEMPSIEKRKEPSPIVPTEALAKIYANQGLFQDAIEAYQQLSLIYPEKNSYFAAQIEMLKKQINTEI